MLYRVFIDAGHGSADPGSLGFRGTKEKDINHAIAIKLKSILQEQGVEISMTRLDDSRLNNQDTIADTLARGYRATEFNAHAYLSIHCNAASPTAHGTETFHRLSNATINDVKLAEAIHGQLVLALGLANRGIKLADFMQFHRAYVPACLVELAFISNQDEEALLLNEAFQWKAAYALADGLMIYLKENVPPAKDEAKQELENKAPIHWAQSSLDELVAKGIVTSSDAWNDLDGLPTKGQLLALVAKIAK